MSIQGATESSLLGFRKLMVVSLGFVVAIVVSLAVGEEASQAAGKYRQPACGGFARQVHKAKNARQRRAARSRLAHCQTNRRVYNIVKNSRFVGVRSDGEPIDITLCANGRYGDDVGSEFEDVSRLGWKITGARLVRGKYFVADFHGKIAGGGERIGSLKRSGRGFMVGIDRSLGDGDAKFGPAKKTNAAGICRRL